MSLASTRAACSLGPIRATAGRGLVDIRALTSAHSILPKQEVDYALVLETNKCLPGVGLVGQRLGRVITTVGPAPGKEAITVELNVTADTFNSRDVEELDMNRLLLLGRQNGAVFI